MGCYLLWLAKRYISSTFRPVGPATPSAEKRKKKKYYECVVNANIYNFSSSDIKTLGPFGEEAQDLAKD